MFDYLSLTMARWQNCLNPTYMFLEFNSENLSSALMVPFQLDGGACFHRRVQLGIWLVCFYTVSHMGPWQVKIGNYQLFILNFLFIYNYNLFSRHIMLISCFDIFEKLVM